MIIKPMKQRTTKKSESFDRIVISSQDKFVESHSVNFGKPSIQREICRQQVAHLKEPRSYIEMPKIHHRNAHLQQISKRAQKTGSEQARMHNRLQLMGLQYAREMEVMNMYPRQSWQEDQDRILNKRKRNLNRQSLAERQTLMSSVLLSFGIESFVMRKRRLLVYVEDGNNSRMIKEVFRKRACLKFTSQKSEANIIWTKLCDYESSKLSSKFHEHPKTATDFHSDDQSPKQPEKPFKEAFHSVPREMSIQSRQSEHAPKQMIMDDLRYHNHLKNHYEITDKKSLLKNLQDYCKNMKLDVFWIVPPTYQISCSTEDKLANVLAQEVCQQGLWLIKPGEDTNRGQGISIASGPQQIASNVKTLLNRGKTALIQKYIEPLLYRGRKFDIRCYALIISICGQIKAYWYKQGYIRTCCNQFSQDAKDVYAHLTNDAIQKKCPTYGKYEQSNKLSFADLQTYMRSKDLIFRETKQQMKQFAYHSIQSAEQYLKSQKGQFSFQILGYDYLIDKRGKVWLLQINTNPCLEFTGSLTSRVIWHMIDNSFRLCLDPLLGRWEDLCDSSTKIVEDNRYECII